MNNPVIDYPCKWSFRIICSDEKSAHQEIAACMCDTDYSLMHSNISRTGKYVSLNLETTVQNEAERNKIYTSLKQIQSIKMII